MSELDITPADKRSSQRAVVSLLDYGVGNVRSVRNAIEKLGYSIVDILTADDINSAEIIVFPGVGNIEKALEVLREKKLLEPLKAYLQSDRPFLGICLGMQILFEGSDECPDQKALGIIRGTARRFDSSKISVPHIGWNGIVRKKRSILTDSMRDDDSVYFVHSFRVIPSEENEDWILGTTTYGEPGSSQFVSCVQKGNVFGCQFHPEKSDRVGLKMLKNFLDSRGLETSSQELLTVDPATSTTLRKRIVACLDVRSNDDGDLVVTKGDQYDVREDVDTTQLRRSVRNLGKPVELSSRYFEEGADEITFLNITSFRQEVLADTPMLQVLQKASEKIFLPLTVGGGIRAYTDSSGRYYSALDVADQYFRSGADKISLGSDAVYAAETYYGSGKERKGNTAIEQISRVYGSQAVVISVDPRRVYVSSPEEAPSHHCIFLPHSPGPNGELYAWYQCTVKGGREGRDIDAIQLVQACEALGAGEILLNCIDMDGQKKGFDIALIQSVMNAVTIPVIASSGAGAKEHFSQVFQQTGVQAALAAGIFHRKVVEISDIKKHLLSENIPEVSDVAGQLRTIVRSRQLYFRCYLTAALPINAASNGNPNGKTLYGKVGGRNWLMLRARHLFVVIVGESNAHSASSVS